MRVRVTPPLALERQYQADLRRLMRQVKLIMAQEVIINLPYLLNGRQDEERMDDLASRIAALFLIARGKIASLLALYGTEKMVQNIATLINQFNAKQFQKVVKSEFNTYRLRGNSNIQATDKMRLIRRGELPGNIPGPTTDQKLKNFNLLKAAIGVDPYSDNPKLVENMNIWVVNNVNLIKNTTEVFVSQSEQIVMDGARRGLRHEVLAKKIMDGTDLEPGRFKTAETRAALIGRDQTNKLNGTLNRLRQQDAGIDDYTWRDVGDARVRHEHRVLDGKVFNWTEGAPSLGGLNPGDDYNCRCYGEPVIDLDKILSDI